ncbi:hypothetical protein H257_18458 [Aphanomyces astaci]|uniref:Uncharacterized protein n=1 Tax=Aphanomyces astaci TaxID=112090 RepID=W4FB05_APHAT|nr:hypothetical protein H257_18458 [Aphanomyces astaci]ETV64680.1 hypothetical protein H257_18458 [Aphanomyces astaci]|eukprot:XP_009845815.1 hypothetical protein H257_18458 [Aphanomyces astaci]
MHPPPTTLRLDRLKQPTGQRLSLVARLGPVFAAHLYGVRTHRRYTTTRCSLSSAGVSPTVTTAPVTTFLAKRPAMCFKQLHGFLIRDSRTLTDLMAPVPLSVAPALMLA